MDLLDEILVMEPLLEMRAAELSGLFANADVEKVQSAISRNNEKDLAQALGISVEKARSIVSYFQQVASTYSASVARIQQAGESGFTAGA